MKTATRAEKLAAIDRYVERAKELKIPALVDIVMNLQLAAWSEGRDEAAIEAAEGDLLGRALNALEHIDKWLLETGQPIDRRDLWHELFLKAHDECGAVLREAGRCP